MVVEIDVIVSVGVEVETTLVVPSKPAPTTEPIRAIAIIAAARPDTITLLVELIYTSDRIVGTNTHVFEQCWYDHVHCVQFLVRGLFKKNHKTMRDGMVTASQNRLERYN